MNWLIVGNMSLLFVLTRCDKRWFWLYLTPPLAALVLGLETRLLMVRLPGSVLQALIELGALTIASVSSIIALAAVSGEAWGRLKDSKRRRSSVYQKPVSAA